MATRWKGKWDVGCGIFNALKDMTCSTSNLSPPTSVLCPVQVTILVANTMRYNDTSRKVQKSILP